MNVKRTAAALIPGVIALLLILGTAISPTLAQEKTGTGTGAAGGAGGLLGSLTGNDNSGANGQDSNPGTAWNIRHNYMLRYPVAKEFGPSTNGGADVIQNKQSMGPGVVVHSTSGPVFIWPYPVPTAISKTPTMRDQAIQKDMFQTFGLPVSDTQFQVISRYNDNRMLEQMFDPEKLMWLATATAGLQATSAANSQANMATNQSESAIDFTKKYLVNFTAEAGNRWQQIRDQLFIPMAILLLLPGAVLAQVRALVAQGSPVLGDINPFDGILRSIVAIFLIPGTFLVINYGIDVSNSITFTIADEYKRIFGTDMYQDAVCAEQRALASNAPNSNLNALPPNSAQQQDAAATQAGQQGQTVWNQYEALTLTTRKYDPCAGVDQQRVTDEQANWQKQVARMMTNSGNVLTTGTWNVMCAFQMAFLYYLWCMGPIAAALWVWPISRLRGALPSWIEGVITVCFWSLFWNTIVLLMACFRGVGDSGIVIMSALNTLAIYAVQYAFDFSSLVSQGGSAGIQQAMQGASQNAQSAAGGGAAGGAGGAAGAAGKGATAGGGAGGAIGGGSTSSSAGLQQALHAATGQNFGSALMGNSGSSSALNAAAHTQPGGALGHSAVPPPLGTAGIQAALGQGGPGGALGGSAGVPHPPLSGAAAPNPMSANGIMPPGGGAGAAGLTSGGGGPGALGHVTPPLSGQSATIGGGVGASGAGGAGAAGLSGSAAHGMALGASAANSTGLGLRMDASGNLHMNQDALHKMQDQMHGQDPQKALQQAMASAQHGDTAALSHFMNDATNAHVLDSQTSSAINGMLHNNAAPTLDSHGALHMGGASALALAHGGEMPLTGVPSGMSAGAMPGGSLSTAGGGPGVPPPHTGIDPHTGQVMGDASHLAKDSAGPLGPLHPGDATSQMQGLHNLAQQEGMPNQGNFHLQDSHGNNINPHDANAMAHVPPGEHLKAVADNGHQFAAYDPGSHQWQATDAAGHAQGVALGGNGSWQAGNVPVTADSSGHFASTAGHYAYEPGSGAPGSGSFNVDGHHLAANSVSGELMSSYSHGSASAHATVDALSHAGVSENLNAAMHGDQAAQAAVQHGLQGTGVHADDLYRASVNGDQLASAHVMGQEALANPSHMHEMAQSLGVSDSTLANAATSHTAAGQVMAADAQQHAGYAADLHMPAGMDAAHQSQFLSEATHNPIAGAQLAGAEIAHDPGYAHQVAQSLGVHDSVVSSAGHNAVAATQMMAAEAAHNPDLARDIGPAMGGHVPPEMMAQAAHNPIAAAQVLGHDVQAHPEYASMAASGLSGSHDAGHLAPAEMMSHAANNPIAAAQVVGMEAQHSGDYAGYVAQSLHMPTTELASQMGHNSVLAAQAVGAEANYDHSYAHSVAAQMHTSPEAVMASASSPTLAAAMVGHQAEQNSAYAAHVASETHMPQSVVAEAAHSPLAATHLAAAEAAAPGHETYAAQVAGPMMHVAGTPQSFDVIAHSPVAAAQALGAEVSAHPAQAAQFAHAMGTSTEQLQHAAHSPIAAAEVVAHDAQAHQGYGSYAAQAMHISDAGATFEHAANHYVAAAQLVAADAAAHPTYGAHVASQLGVSPDVVQQAAHNPVAAAQMVAAEAVHNPQTMHAVAAATHMTPTEIAHAVNDPGAAAMLMAHDAVSHGSTATAYSHGGTVDAGYANHIASEMGIQPQALQHAATSHSAAEQVASAAAHTYSDSYGGSGHYGHAEAPSVASAAHIGPSGYADTSHPGHISDASTTYGGGGGGGHVDTSHQHVQPHVAPVSDGSGHYAAGIQDSSGHFVSAMSDGHGHYVAAIQDGQGHLVPAAPDSTGHYVAADAQHHAQQVGAVQDPQHPGHLIAAVPDQAHPGHVAAAVPSADGQSYVAAIPDATGHYIPADSSGAYGVNTYTPSNEVAYGGGGGGGGGHGETFSDSHVGHGGHSGGGYDPSANPGSYVPHASNLPDFTVAHHDQVPQVQQNIPDPGMVQQNFADTSTTYGGGYTPDQAPAPAPAPAPDPAPAPAPDPVIQPAQQSETGNTPQGPTLSGVLADVFNQSGHSGGTASTPPVSWDAPDPSAADPSGQQVNPVYIADRQQQQEIAPEVIGGAAGAAILGGALGRAIGNAGTPPPRVVAPKPQQPSGSHEQHPESGGEESGHTGHLQGQLKPQGGTNKLNKKRYKEMMADLEPMPGQKKEEDEEEEG